MSTLLNPTGTSSGSWRIGDSGPTIYQGTAPPNNSLGNDGDLYIQYGASTGFFQKGSGVFNTTTTSSIPSNCFLGNNTNATTASPLFLTVPQAQALLGLDLSQYQVVLGNGSEGLTTVLGTGSAGQVLTSSGSGGSPTWQDASSIPIDDLPAATLPLSGNEAVPLFQDGQTVQAPSSQIYAEYVQTITVGGTFTVNLSKPIGSVFTMTLLTSTSLGAVSGAQPAPQVNSFTLVTINQPGNAEITWPSNVRWTGGAKPMLSTLVPNSTDVYVFMSWDGGISWVGQVAAWGVS